MRSILFTASSDQIAHIARVTPFAMLGHMVNTTIAVAAFAGTIPTAELIAWALFSYAVALVIFVRRVRRRRAKRTNTGRAARLATTYAALLALPWAIMAGMHLGRLLPHQELLLVALGVGMSASGSVLLSAVPAAAFTYMSVILIPSAVKCFFMYNQSVYPFIGALALSYWAYLAALVSKVARDITARGRAEQHRNLLVAELGHRVKNVLARVVAVVQRTREGSSSIDEFVAALDGRLQSMAGTHALLSRSLWQCVDLADLARTDLAPYATMGNTVVSGPQVCLERDAAEVLSMVLHELATNAAKYGALSTPQGRVLVSWRKHADDASLPRIELEWRETSGPRVAMYNQAGYGTALVRQLIAYELDGEVELSFQPEGVFCRIGLPWSAAIKSVNQSGNALAEA